MTRLPGLEHGRLKDPAPLKRGPLARALAALNGEGEETRLVGGAVRDLALGLDTGDLDLATTAPPEEAMRRAGAAGFRVIPTGLDHGTVTLILDGERIETTTLREDVETYGRRAKVAFGRDFVADAARRDFTINALSLSPDGRVHDAFGGLADLAARRVRFIGDASARIREDYLRILRFFRFSARFGEGALDPEGLAATIRERAGLERLSRERVRAEVLKIIIAPHAAAVVKAMGDAGFLEPLFGGLAYPGRLERAIAIEAARNETPDPILRLAALALVISENSERLSQRLRLTKAETRRLLLAATALVRLHGIKTPPMRRELEVLMFRFKRRAARDALRLAQADSTALPNDPAFVGADLVLAEAREPRLPVSGAELQAHGVAEGPRMGAILRAFETLWVEAGFPSDAAAVDRLIAQASRDRVGDGAPDGKIP